MDGMPSDNTFLVCLQATTGTRRSSCNWTDVALRRHDRYQRPNHCFNTVSGRGGGDCPRTRTGSSPSIFSVAWSTAFGLGSITRLGYLQRGRTCRRQPNTLKWSSAIARPGGFWDLLRGSSCRGSRLTGSEVPGLR